MKKVLLLLVVTLGYFSSVFAGDAKITKKDVTNYVNKAVKLIEAKGEAGLTEISKTDGKYIKGALYVFVYDETVTIVAHPFKPKIIGKTYKGKPDIKGKKYRDDIVNNTIKDKEAWTEYAYQKPNEKGIHTKLTYSKLAIHNGKKYIVCAGMYK